jgi:hypothetical protein
MQRPHAVLPAKTLNLKSATAMPTCVPFSERNYRQLVLLLDKKCLKNKTPKLRQSSFYRLALRLLIHR